MSRKQFINSPYGFLAALAIIIFAALLLLKVETLKQAYALRSADSHDSALQAKARKLCDEHGGLRAFRATKTKGLLIGTASCVDSTLLVISDS